MESVMKTSLAKSIPVADLASASADDFENLVVDGEEDNEVVFNIKQVYSKNCKIKRSALSFPVKKKQSSVAQHQNHLPIKLKSVFGLK